MSADHRVESLRQWGESAAQQWSEVATDHIGVGRLDHVAVEDVPSDIHTDTEDPASAYRRTVAEPPHGVRDGSGKVGALRNRLFEALCRNLPGVA